MDFKAKVAHAFCTARDKKGLTQEAVAAKVNVSTRWYQDVENARGCPGLQVGLELMEVLEVEPEELLPRDSSYVVI